MMLLGLLLTALCISQCSALERERRFFGKEDPEVGMDAYQLISSKGYPAEEHTVQTSDGYRLTVHRIPHGLGQQPGNRPVIFLQHGLLCSSTNWLTNLANESLGFIMADAGFDVWMGNFRGNTYSSKHATLDPSSKAFWQFSWDEMALIDLPAMINYALETSGQTELYYAGHSEGTMTAFALFSTNKTMGAKVKKFFAMGPVTTVKHIKGLLAWIAPFSNSIGTIMDWFGAYQFLPNDWIMKVLARTLCGWSYTNPLCGNVLFLIAGPDSTQLNTTREPVYMSHTPAGTSVMNVLHFAQGVKSGAYSKYDFGSAKANQAHYGQDTPPAYHPEEMETPVVLLWGQNDWLADPSDIAALVPKLKNVIGNYGYELFNHLDFIWGMQAPTKVYNKIVEMSTN